MNAWDECKTSGESGVFDDARHCQSQKHLDRSHDPFILLWENIRGVYRYVAYTSDGNTPSAFSVRTQFTY